MPTHIVIITTSYPSSRDPGAGSFVQKLARDLINLGEKTTVITPLRIWHRLDKEVCGRNAGRPEPEIFRPRYISCSGKMIPGIGSTFLLTIRNFHAAARRALFKLQTPPTHIYGHFLYPAGYVAAQLARETGSKSAVGLGENFFDRYERQLGIQRIKQTLKEIDSVIAVADHLRDRCVDNYDIPRNKILTARNAHSFEFSPLTKSAAREGLNLPQHRPIIGFVGAFDDNKRPLYVLKAIENRPDIGIFFLGKPGAQKPRGEQVLFAGSVPHDEVAKWLSAADVFVHTSLAEMSSNAIVEARACGLPIIATDIPGNREVLSSSYSILVDTWDQRMLSHAIFKLIDNPELRMKMSNAALAAAQEYTSIDRARNILSWITS